MRNTLIKFLIFYRKIKWLKKTKFYNRYRKKILFNNLILSGVISFLVGALTTQIYALFYSGNLSNALVTLLVGYCVYIPQDGSFIADV
jgi:hypothetical protein